MTRKEFHTKAFLYLCILIAFFLPAYIHVVPILIGIILLNWLAEGNFPEKISLIRKNKIALLFISLYLLHIIGMLWTENKSSGWFDLEVKLSILLFPLIIASQNAISGEKIKLILNSFVFGCIAAGIVCY